MKSDHDANTTTLSLPRGVHHHQEPDVDTITWVNKDVPLSIITLLFIFIGWALFITGAILADYGLFTKGIKTDSLIEQIAIVIMLVLLNLITILYPFIFRGLLWKVTIKISNEDIVFTQSDPLGKEVSFPHPGPWTPKEQQFRKEDVLGLSFDRESDEGTGIVPSLAIKYKSSILGITGHKEEELALWMKTKEQYRLFRFIKMILETRGWDIEFNDIYENSIWFSNRSIFD